MPLLAFLGPLKCVCRVVTAFFMAFLIFPAAAETASPPISGSNGLMGLWGANSSAPQTGSSGKPISGSNEQQGATAPGTPTESSPPSANSQDAELRVKSTKRATKCRAAAHIRFQWTDGEWGANSSQPQSGKPISGSNDQQDTTAPGIPTESSPPSADAQDAELKSSPQDAELKSSPPDAELESKSTKRATKCRAFAQCSIRFQWTDRVERKQLGIADGLQWKADQRFKRPTGHHCSWHSRRVESTERGCTGCRAQVESTGCRAQVESTGCRARVEVHQARHEMSRLRPVLNPVPMD